MVRSKIFAAGATLAVVGSAQAIDFGTTAFIDSVPYTIGGSGSPIVQIGNSLSFSLPAAIALSGTKTVVLDFTVNASPGYYVSKTTSIPTGNATGASSTSVSTTFTNGSTTETTSNTYTGVFALNPFSHVFTNQFSTWNGKTTINLNANQGISKVSAFTINFEETLVPEPATMGIIAAGLLGVALRKKKQK